VKRPEKGREGDQGAGGNRHSSCLFPARVCGLHLRLCKGKRALDDAFDAGNIHHVGHSVRNRPLHAYLYYNHGAAEVAVVPEEKLVPVYGVEQELAGVEVNVIRITAKYLLMFLYWP